MAHSVFTALFTSGFFEQDYMPAMTRPVGKLILHTKHDEIF